MNWNKGQSKKNRAHKSESHDIYQTKNQWSMGYGIKFKAKPIQPKGKPTVVNGSQVNQTTNTKDLLWKHLPFAVQSKPRHQNCPSNQSEVDPKMLV